MEFFYRERPTLPRLAWCVYITKENKFITVFHGSWVEIRKNFFCEGAWNGDFADGRLDKATAFMGSGGVLHNDGITFATPTHFLEKLYFIREQDKILVSNSLAFILAEVKDACDPTYLNYLYDLVDFHMRGLHRPHTTLPTANRRKVHLYQRCNIIVSPNLDIKIFPKQAMEEPVNFFQYYKLLQEGVKGINDNSLSNLRKRTYPSLATISSGYDSTACAVLAKEIGCKEAVTLVSARPDSCWGEDLNDSGTKIAEALNLSVIEYDRLAYKQHSNFPEAEFCACGTGEDINQLAMQDSLTGKMVFTGARGDFVWERLGWHIPSLSTVSFGLTEFRLRIGYIHMAPISIGEEYNRTIVKISNSPEMNLWSIRDFYDRPIPRRIAEEAGIPRSYFGQQKKATSNPIIWGTKGMTEKSALDFQDFARPLYKERKFFRSTMYGLGRFFLRLNSLTNRVVCAVAKNMGIELRLYPIFSQRYRRPFSIDDLTFHWGQEKVANRYKQSD